MNILRPLFAGIATGIGLRIGGDLYDKFKRKAEGDDNASSFNPFRKDEAAAQATSTVDATAQATD